MTASPRIVCACCSTEIPLGSPVCKECAADIGLGLADAPPAFCPLCAHRHESRGGLHYNNRGGYIGKCAAEVSA